MSYNMDCMECVEIEDFFGIANCFVVEVYCMDHIDVEE